jgi:hypothetical protein
MFSLGQRGRLGRALANARRRKIDESARLERQQALTDINQMDRQRLGLEFCQHDFVVGPQHITPRFTETEIDAALSPVRARIAQLEAENKMLRKRLRTAEAG